MRARDRSTSSPPGTTRQRHSGCAASACSWLRPSAWNTRSSTSQIRFDTVRLKVDTPGYAGHAADTPPTHRRRCMANHLTPSEIADEVNMKRREVISKCMEMGVPIFQGKIDKSLFVTSLEQLTQDSKQTQAAA